MGAIVLSGGVSTKCLICLRQACGWGHLDLRFGVADPRRYPRRWVFCSRRCLEVFHAWFERCGGHVKPDRELVMIDPSDLELAAMRRCLKALGEVANEIGFDVPLARYDEGQALRLVDAIVTCYSTALVEGHEAEVRHATQA